MSKDHGVTDLQIDQYLAKSGLTRLEEEANLRRRYPRYSPEKIREELAIGPLCERALGAMKNLAQRKPEIFWSDEPFWELRI